jgi:hypothetical protein
MSASEVHWLEAASLQSAYPMAKDHRTSALGETCCSTHHRAKAGKSHFLPFRVIDTSLTVCGSVYVNERPNLGSRQSGLNVRFWVVATNPSVAG